MLNPLAEWTIRTRTAKEHDADDMQGITPELPARLHCTMVSTDTKASLLRQAAGKHATRNSMPDGTAPA
jgi:hypothetical protein